MVITIKGPIKIKSGSELPEEIKSLIMKQYRLKEKKTGKIDVEIKFEAKGKVYTREDLDKMKFKELRKIGYKLKVKDRNRDTLIDEILKAQH